ncbi:MAG: YifB family Mg chelatase-like AAA ATPase [Opitutaceae bacterium]|jgi:magnesium chelatase family protein|nr:YifB family Mg chelatase-like AAA ATPase [Opitutaceae bacterium]
MLSTLLSAALNGIEAQPVHIEVNTGERGEWKLVLVGLPDSAVKESGDRVSSALANSGFSPPRTRTTINLAPGDLRKEGPFYDLPIALGMLVATGQIAAPAIGNYLIAGELALSGATRPVRGALAIARLARSLGCRGLVLPAQSAVEAALVEGLDVFAVNSLAEAARFLSGPASGPGSDPGSGAASPPSPPLSLEPVRHDDALRLLRTSGEHVGDFAEVKGQQALRRAVEVAVAGGHNLIMVGPPGSGKSMIAKRIPSIMPAPTLDESLEILAIHSAAGQTISCASEFGRRPVRSPHHTISDVGLLGGGTIPGPGEISLAHHGVLFLDELPEFKRSALEVLRQPLEDGAVTISRSAGKVTLPCGFMLVAAMNPCPCGYLGDPRHECRCGPTQIQRYRARISGPLLDRIDIHIEAPALAIGELRSAAPGEPSATIRDRVQAARDRQLARFRGSRTLANARMTHAQIREHVPLDAALGDLLQQAMEQLSLSARAWDRILKVARTIADLASSDRVESNHLLEAIQYRSLDRNLFY